MKKFFLLPALAISVSWAACNTGAGNMAQMNTLKDSVFNAVPTAAAVTINVQNDRLLLITLGDATLYKADAAQRQATAAQLGAMAERIFGKDNHLEKARLIITGNEHNEEAEPADGITTEIELPKH